MDVSALVLEDGSLTRAQGRVVAFDGKTWFEPSLGLSHVLHPSGDEPPPRPSGWGVPVIGVDVDALTWRSEKDGGTEGYASLAGIWAEECLVVSRQAAPGLLPEHRVDRPARPTAAWPREDAEAAYVGLRDNMRSWLAYEISQTESWDGSLTVTAKVVRVLPALTGWAESLPDGMLTLDVWLAPHPRAL